MAKRKAVTDVAAKVKYCRGNLALTQTQLAQRLKVTRACVNAWEMGISAPSIYFLISLANTFSITTDFLLGRTVTETIDITDLQPVQKMAIYALMDSYRHPEK